MNCSVWGVIWLSQFRISQNICSHRHWVILNDFCQIKTDIEQITSNHFNIKMHSFFFLFSWGFDISVLKIIIEKPHTNNTVVPLWIRWKSIFLKDISILRWQSFLYVAQNMLSRDFGPAAINALIKCLNPPKSCLFSFQLIVYWINI